MKIIKQGKSKEELEAILKAEKRFECSTCGCVFTANNDEYRYEEDYIYSNYYCKCPNCGRNAYQLKERRFGMTELKPCFCCKCKPTVKRLRKNCYQVSCTNPMCFSVIAVCADTEEKAIIAWNRRRENDEP